MTLTADPSSTFAEAPPVSEREPDAPRFYNATEVAAMFGVSRMTVYRAIDDGDIPAIRVRGRRIIPARAVDAMVQESIDSMRSSREHTDAPNDELTRAIGGVR